MLEDARGMAPSATDLSSLLAHVEDDPNAAVARENDLFVSAQARIEEQRLGLSRGPMTHEVKGPPVMVASPPRLKPLPHRPKRPPPPMPDVARMIMLQNRVVRAFQHPHAVGKAELGPKDLGLTDAQKAKLKLMSLRRTGGDAPVVPEPIPQEKPELPRTTSERVAELKAEREAAAAEAAKEAEAAPLLSAEEEMAREMEAARREAEAMMASFQAAHEESKEARRGAAATVRDGPAAPRAGVRAARLARAGRAAPLRFAGRAARLFFAGRRAERRSQEKEGARGARRATKFIRARARSADGARGNSIKSKCFNVARRRRTRRTGRSSGRPVAPRGSAASGSRRCRGRRRPSGSPAGCRSGSAAAADPYRRGAATPRASPSPLPVLGFAGCSRPSGRRPE